MLTPEQIAALRDAAGRLADPINAFLLDDIARRIAGAGQLTSTAAYQIYRAQQLGLSRRAIEARLRALLGVNRRTLKTLLTQAAEVGYNFDIKHLPRRAVPFRKNTGVQQMVAAAVRLAQDDFTNLTQTLGMVDPFGRALPLRDAYRSTMDFAFAQVFTGATDYNTAIRRATKNLAGLGVRVIDYESGVHTGLEAAVRRNVMGGLGLMVEQIAQKNHDDLGCDGWEITAHAASAPDHEPIQGRQYSDARYQALNGSLVRRIGTLNCGHAAFPIILGINSPQYTPEELRKFREDNERGVTYEGRHYTGYEATQQQRKVERAIRRQKNRILVDEATGDKEKLVTDQIRLQRLNQEYARFSKATGLPTQSERAQVAGFGRGQAARASSEYKRVAKLADSMYDVGSQGENIEAYLRDLPIREQIRSGKILSTIEPGQFRKHVPGTLEYKQYVEKLQRRGQFGPSRLSLTQKELEALVQQFKGSGILNGKVSHGVWSGTETITMNPTDIGVVVNNLTGAEAPTPVFKIHYGPRGIHIVPDYPSKKGAKAKK